MPLPVPSLATIKSNNFFSTTGLTFVVKAELNTTEGIKQALYGLLDGVEKVRDVAEYPGVVEYKCTVNEDNLIAIFTKWVGRERIDYNEFTVYAKTYIPSGSFEDSDFVE